MKVATLIGYARTSTDPTIGPESQLCDLKAAGCDKIFQEEVSSASHQRPQLEAAINWAREGDVLIATTADRLARSASHLLDIMTRLRAKGSSVKFLHSSELDTNSPEAGLLLTKLSAIAEFERQLSLERQREGVAKAKAEGRYVGRRPTAILQKNEVFRMWAEGKSAIDIQNALGLSKTSVYRLLEELPVETKSP